MKPHVQFLRLVVWFIYSDVSKARTSLSSVWRNLSLCMLNWFITTKIKYFSPKHRNKPNSLHCCKNTKRRPILKHFNFPSEWNLLPCRFVYTVPSSLSGIQSQRRFCVHCEFCPRDWQINWTLICCNKLIGSLHFSISLISERPHAILPATPLSAWARCFISLTMNAIHSTAAALSTACYGNCTCRCSFASRTSTPYTQHPLFHW